jgi:hypothetical protein
MMLNCEDRTWVELGLKFWQRQEKKHPKDKMVRKQREQFQVWLRQIENRNCGDCEITENCGRI